MSAGVLQVSLQRQQVGKTKLIRGSGTVPSFAWFLVVVSSAMIILAIVLKPEPVADEFAHIADSDLESFLAPAAGGNVGEEPPRKTFSLRETMERRMERAKC